MSILIDATTRVILQGFTGGRATVHAKAMIDYGTRVVGNVTAGN
jgi:malate-CoA ligase subunit alpha